MPVSDQRQPWPMKWIIIAIVLIVLPYTFLTLRYRKPGPAFQPYEDMRNRANVSRLLEAGYQRIFIPAQRPADGPRANEGSVVATIDGGLPAELRSTLVEAPLLPAEITSVTAAPVANAVRSYAIRFTCTLPDDTRAIGGAELFVRGDSIVVTPTFGNVTAEMKARTKQPEVLLSVPAGALKPGTYQVTLVGERTSRSWSLEVK